MISTTIVSCLTLIMLTPNLWCVEQFGIAGAEIVCKTGQGAREVGDFPTLNDHQVSQFQYTTQDNYSCRITFKKGPGQATGVTMDFSERYKRDPLTRKAVEQTPNDYGIPGDFSFMYITKNTRGGNLYGFVDYGSDMAIKNILEAVKLSRHVPKPEMRQQLQTKAPATLESLKTHGASVSK